MTNQDDSINLLKTLAEPQSWGEETSFNHEAEVKSYEDMETKPDGLPPFIRGDEFPPQYELPRRRPMIEDILKRGEIMALFAASKMGKSWFLQNMATCMAEGLPFLGSEVMKSNCLIIDLELSQVDSQDRLWSIALAMGLKAPPRNISLWSLRKHSYDLELITEVLHSRFEQSDPFDCVFLDPLYLFGTGENFDENSSSCVTELMLELSKLTSQQEASLIVSHHYRKGVMGKESHFDRASGSGAFARFPDVLTTLSDHALPQHCIFEMTSRSQRGRMPFVIKNQPPVFELAENADPNAFRRYGDNAPKLDFTPDSFISLIPSDASITRAEWFSKARMQGLSENKFDHLLSMVRQSGMVKQVKDDGIILYSRNAGL